MKAKVLFWKYNDQAGSGIERIYMPENFEQAEKDLILLQDHSAKIWGLADTEIYGEQKSVLDKKIEFSHFSARTANTIKSMNLVKIGDLMKLSKKKLLSTKRIGQSAIGEISDYLYKHNLQLPIEL